MPKKDVCCVAGCKNTRLNSAVKFYHFPSTKFHQDCRRAWLKYVRSTHNSSDWLPSDSTRICSVHFTAEPAAEFETESDGAPSTSCPCHPQLIFLSAGDAESNAKDVGVLSLPPDETEGESASFRASSSTHDYVVTPHKEKSFAEEYEGVRKQFPDTFAYIQELEKKNADLEAQLKSVKQRTLSLSNCRDDPKVFNFYTGLPNYETFSALFQYLEPKVGNLQQWRGSETPSTSHHRDINPDGSKSGRDRQLDREEEFFLVLVRLKMGLLLEDISRRAGISASYFSKLFSTWIIFLFHELSDLNKIPTSSSLREHLPASFKDFQTTRVIVDCTELFSERPNRLEAQKQTFSNYKHHNTFKFMIGVTPSGSVCYVSDAYGGRASDKLITSKSDDFLEQLEEGDAVMADRGFLIEAFLTPLGVNLVMPAFKGSHRDQLSSEEVTKSRRIAEARIIVERAIGRIRTFHIFDSDVKMTQKHLAKEIFTVCAFLCNFKPALIKQKSH